MNNKDRFIKTALCLVLAFAMTFAPIVSSYAVMVTAFTGQAAAEAEDETGDMVDNDIDSEDQPYLDQSEDGNSNDQTITEEELTAEETNSDEEQSDQVDDADDVSEPSAEEAAPETPEEAAPAEESEQEEEAAPEDTQDTYVYEDKKVRVTAVLEDPTAIPDGAKLVATPINKDSSDYNYDAYLDALNKGSDSNYSEKNTILYDVAFIKDGVELQPTKGKVSVNFEFLDSQLTETLGAKKAADVNVIHLPLADSVKEQFDTTADAKKISADDINVEEVNKVSVNNDNVKFETSDFSVFAYTVDFEYGEYKFSIPGEGSIELSKVFEQLHIDKKVSDVEDVKFSNPELLEVKKNLLGNDWTLKSKKAFSTEETLTIVFKDGEKIIINVTDDQDGSENGFKVDLLFYGYDGTTEVDYHKPEEYDKLFVYVELMDSTGNPIGWNKQEITSQFINADGSIKELSFGKFGPVSNKYNPETWSGDAITYDSTQHSVSVRIYSTDPNYHLIHDDLTEYEKRPDDTIDGYKFLGQFTPTDEEYKPRIGNDKSRVKLKQWNGSHLYVDVNFDPELSTEISESDGYWIRAELKHSTGPNTYAVAKLISTEDPTRIELTEWRDASNFNIIEHEKFTASEPSVNVQLVKTRSGKTADATNVAKLNHDVVEVVAVGSAVKDYKVESTDGELDIKSRKIDDENLHETDCIYNINLTKQSLENALTPEDILGDAAEYGIVANRYDQYVHTETNFAVNYFTDSASQSIEIDGSGDNPIPFYVGKVDTVRGDGTEVPKSQFWIASGTKVPADIYATPEDIAANKYKNTNTHPTEFYPTSQADINAYVNGLIRDGQAMSASLASKTTLKPTFTGQNYVLDTTGFPDNTTIYVDADGIADSLVNNGWSINKLPGQSIVFNISKSSNTTKDGRNVIQIGKFTVDPNDGKGSVESTTSALDGDPEHNKRVDDVIFEHITFNITNATDVHLNDASGLFLLPKADHVTQDNGAGWILAKGTVESHTEWHFYRHYRKYKAKGDFTLRAEKILKNGNDPVDLDGKTFTFALYQIEIKDGKTVETEKQVVDSNPTTGEIDFTTLKFTESDVEEGETETFNYVVREIEPEDKEPGIEYTKEPIYIRVKATNTPDSEGSESGEITFEIRTYSIVDGEEILSDPITPTADSDGKLTIFGIGPFVNHIEDNKGGLKIKKTWDGVPDGTDVSGLSIKITAPDKTERTITYADFDANGEYVIGTSLPVGATYQVEETNAGTLIANYSLKADSTTSGSGTVEKDKTNTISLLNKYEQDKGGLKIKKTWDGVPDGTDVSGLSIKITAPDKTERTITYADFDANGEYVIGTSLPVGATYQVEETNAGTLIANYSLKADSTTSGSGTVEKDKTNTISLLNKYEQDKGGLKIKKTWDGVPDGTDVSGLSIKITAPDKTERTITYADFDANGEYVIGTSLPVGATYQVEETNAGTLIANYSLKADSTTSGSGTVEKDKTNTISLLNKYEQDKGGLKIKKTWDGVPDGTDVSGLSIKITAPDKTERTITYADFDANGEYVIGTSLPVGATYQVEETNAGTLIANYSLKADSTTSGSGTVEKDKTNTISLLNKYEQDKGGLKIKKTWDGVPDGTDVSGLSIKITAPDKTERTITYADFDANGEYVIGTSLPVGATYQVEETNAGTLIANYSLKADSTTSGSGTVEKDKTNTISLLNKYEQDKGGLKIKKTWDGVPDGTDVSGLSIKITAPDKTERTITYADFDANGEYVIGTSLPVGATYQVEETNAGTLIANYSLKADSTTSGSGTVEKDKTNTISLLNKYEQDKGGLKIKKTWDGVPDGTDVSGLSIKITAPDKTERTITYADFDANGEYVIGTSLPVGATYQVEETNAGTLIANYSLKADSTTSGSGTVEKDKTNTISLLNKYEQDKGGLKIKKTWDGVPDGTDVSGLSIKITAPDKTERTITYADFDANGEYVIGTSLPVGATYQVEETNAGTLIANYSLKADSTTSGSGTVEKDKTNTISLLNKYEQDKGGLKIKKTWDGVPDGTDVSGLSIKITAPDKTERTITYADFDANGEYVIGTSLPVGATYQVEETNAGTLIANYSLKADSTTSGSGTVEKDKTNTISLLNKYEQDKGGLKIKKTWDGVPDGTDVSGLSIKITAPDKTERTITYADFDANGEYVIGTSLPVGATYQVEETNAGTLIANYSLKADSTTSGSGTVEKDKTNTISLLNKYEQDKGGLKIKKTWDGVPDGTDVSGLSIKITAPDKTERTITYADFDANGEYVIGTSLPVGATYQVEETNAGTLIANYSLKADSTTSGSGTVEKDKTNTISLLNKYEQDKGSLKIKKTVKENNKAPSAEVLPQLAGRYEFTIYTNEACTDAYMIDGTAKTVTLTVGRDEAEATSAEVTDLPVGDYWIKETKPSNGSVPVENPVKVTVQKGKTGDAAVIASFTNNLATVETELKATKSINNWGKENKFTFRLTPAKNESGEASPMPAGLVEGSKYAYATKEPLNLKAAFGTIKYTKAGTYNYTINEMLPAGATEDTNYTVDGITYDHKTHYVEVTVTPGEDGNLTATVKYDNKEDESVEIKNTYDAKGTATLKGAKNIEGREFKSGDSATMKIEAVDPTDAPMPEEDTVTVKPTEGKKAAFQFGDIEYKLANIPEGAKSATFTYKVTESAYSMQGVGEKDRTEYTVTVTISDKGDGTLNVKLSENATGLNFKNKYDAKGTATLKGAKNIEGRAFKSGDSATMKIEAMTKDAPMPEEDTVTVKPTEGKKAAFQFGDIEYKLANIPEGAKSATFKYKVTESAYTMEGVAEKDSTEYTVTVTISDKGDGTLNVELSDNATGLNFRNKYDAKGTATLKGAKNIEGRAFKAGDSATMKIEAITEGAPLPKKTTVTVKPEEGETAAFQFEDIEYELADIPEDAESATFEYKVTESAYSMQGVGEKDSTEYTVTVTISDNTDGTLNVVTSDNAKSLYFTNKYKASGAGEIKVQKVLEGRDWTNGDSFTFTITGKNGAPMPEVGSISITKSDRKHIKSFGEIRFSNAGTYTYIVKESKGSLGGVTYDETEHEVTIKVADNGKGKLVAAEGTKLVQTEVFTNAYRAKEAKGEIKVQKLLQGRAWNDSDQFTFTLSADKGTPMPAETTITIRKSDADNIRSFGEIKFKKAGKYTYTVRETKGNIKGVNYDTKAHKVTIEVVDDGNGHLVAKEGTSLIQTVKITNTTGVKTGDENQILLPMAGMLTSLLALLLIVIRRRKSRA